MPAYEMTEARIVQDYGGGPVEAVARSPMPGAARVSVDGEPYSSRLLALLASGWEPFAVQAGTVFLRRPRP